MPFKVRTLATVPIAQTTMGRIRWKALQNTLYVLQSNSTQMEREEIKNSIFLEEHDEGKLNIHSHMNLRNL